MKPQWERGFEVDMGFIHRMAMAMLIKCSVLWDPLVDHFPILI